MNTRRRIDYGTVGLATAAALFTVTAWAAIIAAVLAWAHPTDVATLIASLPAFAVPGAAALVLAFRIVRSP